MRVIVEAHVLGLGERRLHRIVAGRLVRGIPIRDRGASRDVQVAAFLRELGFFNLASAVGLTGPAWHGDAAAGDGASCFLSESSCCSGNKHEDAACNSGYGRTTHGLNPPYWEKVIGDDYSALHSI